MKMRTDLIANVMLGNKVSPTGTDEDIEHDALAAHALLQAMKEVRNETPYASCISGIEYVFERADELMREWTSKSEV